MHKGKRYQSMREKQILLLLKYIKQELFSCKPARYQEQLVFITNLYINLVFGQYVLVKGLKKHQLLLKSLKMRTFA